MNEITVDIGNVIAVVAVATIIVFALLVYRMTRATWTLMMAVGFALFGVVRIGIAADTPGIEPWSRTITAGIYILFAGAFALLWWNMRKFYNTNGFPPVDYAAADRAARMVKLAELAATKAAESASKAAEAAKMAETIAQESRAAAIEANRSTTEARE
jgi:hypothetical protein